MCGGRRSQGGCTRIHTEFVATRLTFDPEIWLVASVASVGTSGGRARSTRPRACRLRHHRIGEREVVKDGFIRPLTRRVRRQAPGQLGRRPEFRGDGGEPQMLQDLSNDCRAFDHGDDLHGPAAARTDQRVHVIDLADQAGPGSANLQGRSSAFGANRFRPFGFPPQAVALAIAPRPIGVPAIEEGGLLVGVGDVGAMLDQEARIALVFAQSARDPCRPPGDSPWQNPSLVPRVRIQFPSGLRHLSTDVFRRSPH